MATATLFGGAQVKNADVTAQTTYNGYVNGAYVRARYRSSSVYYQIGGISYYQKLTVMHGSTVIAEVNQVISAGDTIRVLFVDDSLKVYYNGVLKIDITTTHSPLAGTWAIDADNGGLGTPISSLNLDSVAGTNVQLQAGGAFKTVESMQIQVGGMWKTVSGVQVNVSGVWKTAF